MNSEVTRKSVPTLYGTIKRVPQVDNTLTKAGCYADAKAVGDILRNEQRAVNFSYDSNGNGLKAETIQDALDELNENHNKAAENVVEALEELNKNIEAMEQSENLYGVHNKPTADDVGSLTYYKSLSSIGLKDDSTTYTIEQVCAAVPNWSTLILGVSKGKITDLPISYGTLEIVKGDTNYCAVRLTNSSSVSTNLFAYMGRYAPNQTNRWSGWFQINFTKVE